MGRERENSPGEQRANVLFLDGSLKDRMKTITSGHNFWVNVRDDGETELYTLIPSLGRFFDGIDHSMTVIPAAIKPLEIQKLSNTRVISKRDMEDYSERIATQVKDQVERYLRDTIQRHAKTEGLEIVGQILVEESVSPIQGSTVIDARAIGRLK